MYSIIVPTFNRAQALPRALRSLQAQQTDVPYEVIVVDNNSTDSTASVVQSVAARSDGLVRYVFEERQGVSLARNRGVADARGDVLVFLDDDVVPRPDWLDALADTYRRHPDAWCVGGKIVLVLPDTWPRWFDPDSLTFSTYLSGLSYGDGVVALEHPDDVWGAHMSFRRDVVSRVGMFDPQVGLVGFDHRVGEDTQFCRRIRRAGGRIYYCGRAVVEHVVPAERLTKRWFRMRAYQQGQSDAQLRVLPASAALSELGHWALAWLKDAVKTVCASGGLDPRRMFEDELALWRYFGAVRHHACGVTLSAVPSLNRPDGPAGPRPERGRIDAAAVHPATPSRVPTAWRRESS